MNCKNNPFRNRSTKIKVKLLFQTQIKNIIQAIQCLAGHVHPPTEHSKNVWIPSCKVFRNILKMSESPLVKYSETEMILIIMIIMYIFYSTCYVDLSDLLINIVINVKLVSSPFFIQYTWFMIELTYLGKAQTYLHPPALHIHWKKYRNH